MRGKLEELVCNYGKIDILQFEFSCDGMTGEKLKATELVRRVHIDQPDAIMDKRLEASSDFVSPEQIIKDESGRNINDKDQRA